MSRRAALQLTGHVRSNWIGYLLGAVALLVTSTTSIGTKVYTMDDRYANDQRPIENSECISSQYNF